MVKWEDPHASDNSGNVSTTCYPPSGNNFTIGQTVIICEAVDSSGNKAQCYFDVNVIGKYFFSLPHKKQVYVCWG